MSYCQEVDLTSLLAPATRIIDVAPTGPGTAAWLASRGHDRYLGLVAPEHVDAVRRQADGMELQFQPLTSASQVVRNNADLLILRSPFDRCLWSVRDLRHVRYVAIDAAAGLATVEGRLAQLAGSTMPV